MRIGEIGGAFTTVTKISYLSDQTLMDFDFIILDFDSAIRPFNVHQFNIATKRNQELEEFIKYKKVPIVIFPPISNNQQFVTGTIQREVQFEELLPARSFAVERVIGKDMEVKPNTPFTSFLTKYKKLFAYASYFTRYTGKIIAEVPFNKKVLAFYNESVVFIPRLSQEFKQHESDFLLDLTTVVSGLNKEPDEIDLPTWSTKYLLPLEVNFIKQIDSLSRQMADLVLGQKNAETDLENLRRKKILFTGTGKQLEREVEKIFEILGFKILESEEGRDDFTIEYNGKIAVVEIKGVVGSSAEKHAAQLEKWVSTYHENNDVLPKGILIVNSYREEILINRTDDTFPHQMLKYSETRGHCLITGLQLLNISFEVEKYPEKKEDLINSLFETIGVYKDFRNWSDYIEVTNET